MDPRYGQFIRHAIAFRQHYRFRGVIALHGTQIEPWGYPGEGIGAEPPTCLRPPANDA